MRGSYIYSAEKSENLNPLSMLEVGSVFLRPLNFCSSIEEFAFLLTHKKSNFGVNKFSDLS